jgi:hypothetical protein
MRRFAALLACALVSSSASPPLAHAQPGGDVSDAYRQHMEYGVKLYQDKNYQAAVAEFEAAYRVRPKASPLINISLCYKGLFIYPKAIAALETALAKHPDSMSDADKKAAQEAIVEMRGLLAYVTLDLSPPNAVVTVDGEDLPPGAASKPIPLGPGTHRISARADGFASSAESVNVASGQKDKKVKLRLVPDKGWVTVRADDNKTAIAIDGKAMGYGSWAGFLSPGTHLVQMYQPGASSSYSVNVSVTAGKTQDIRPGVGGVPITAGGPPPDVPPDVPDKPAPKPEPVTPPLRGIYGLVTASLLAPLAHPQEFKGGEGESGAAGGLRAGYRLNNAAAFEGMFEYGNVTVEDEFLERSSYSLSSLRFGLNLRLMTPGRKVRFVGTLGGGLVHDTLEYDIHEDDQLEPIGIVCKPDECKGTSGWDPYLLSELGIEMEFGGVLVGAAFMTYFQAMKGLDSAAYGNDPIVSAGGGVRIGYATW